MGSSSQSTTGKTDMTYGPKWAQNNLMQFNGLLGNALNQAGQDNSDGLNLDKSVMTATANGSMLSPESNPWFNQVVNSMTSASNESFNKNLNQLAQTVNKSGFNTTGKEIASGGKLAQSYASGLSGQVGSLASGIYGQERQNQLTAASQLPALDAVQLQKALTLGGFLRGLGQYGTSSSNTVSNPGLMADILAPLSALGGAFNASGTGAAGFAKAGIL